PGAEMRPVSSNDRSGKFPEIVAKLAREAGMSGVTPKGVQMAKEIIDAPETNLFVQVLLAHAYDRLLFQPRRISSSDVPGWPTLYRSMPVSRVTVGYATGRGVLSALPRRPPMLRGLVPRPP